jgi:hypothetical protein
MALNANTVWEVRTTGSDNNGGGFYNRSAGTSVDYSQQDAAQLNLTDLACNNSTTVTSVTGGFTAAMVGNLIHITAGTGWTAGFYEITARASSNSVTFDRKPCSSSVTGGTGYVGGACASLGNVVGAFAGGNICWVKAGTYTLTSATANVSGGIVLLPLAPCMVIGYQTTRGDYGTKPLIAVPGDGSVTGVSVISGSASAYYSIVANLAVDCASQATMTGITLGQYCRAYKCKVSNSTVYGISLGSPGVTCYGGAILCEVTGHSGTTGIHQLSGGIIYGCYVHDGTCEGYHLVGNVHCLYSIADTNTGAGIYGFYCNTPRMVGCVAYGNGASGFYFYKGNNWLPSVVIGCIAEGNGTYGFEEASNNHGDLFLNNAAYGNGTADLANLDINFEQVLGMITQTAGSFFVDAANGNFALNSTAGRGALLRAAGILGAFPGGLTTGYADIGAAQHTGTIKTLNGFAVTGINAKV